AQRFAVGPHWLELVQPGDGAGDPSRHLAERGEGPFALTLRGAGAQTAAALSQALAHGARISVVRGG
ncbi:MAG: hypothetical protein M3Q10_03075, partial [Chloroflexota bacterium]|nr:hypothetical protein [Chloroflexota bacterium]